MAEPEEDLQDRIVAFVKKHGPKDMKLAGEFVWDLRSIMNEYARFAILHGNLPEAGMPHKSP